VFDLKSAAMQSLRAGIEAIRGVLDCTIDDGATILATLRIPANLSFLQCTVVRIGATLAAIPMSGVDEIVRPEPDQIVGTGSSRVVLIRDGAAALLDGCELFGEPSDSESRPPTPYAVIVSHGGRRVALSCGRAIGAQEIVVRSIDPMPRRLGPISGVGAASDGAAALIVDVPGLVRMVDGCADR
jgi:two-component system chemotaxis sensor kinase CheA